MIGWIKRRRVVFVLPKQPLFPVSLFNSFPKLGETVKESPDGPHRLTCKWSPQFKCLRTSQRSLFIRAPQTRSRSRPLVSMFSDLTHSFLSRTGSNCGFVFLFFLSSVCSVYFERWKPLREGKHKNTLVNEPLHNKLFNLPQENCTGSSLTNVT